MMRFVLPTVLAMLCIGINWVEADTKCVLGDPRETRVWLAGETVDASKCKTGHEEFWTPNQIWSDQDKYFCKCIGKDDIKKSECPLDYWKHPQKYEPAGGYNNWKAHQGEKGRCYSTSWGGKPTRYGY